jgi:hypothetical protein
MAAGLSDADRELQARTRNFANEELIPWEVHAEMNNGEIPEDVKARHEMVARQLGLTAIERASEIQRAILSDQLRKRGVEITR